MYKRIFKRNDNKDLLLFGLKPHIENNTAELTITPSSTPHLRWNPSRHEWVTYSTNRSSRTAFPPKEYCPLCPGGNLNFPTEIPFYDFEVAVFPNRWSSFNTHNTKIEIPNIKTITGIPNALKVTQVSVSTVLHNASFITANEINMMIQSFDIIFQPSSVSCITLLKRGFKKFRFNNRPIASAEANNKFTIVGLILIKISLSK